MDAWSSPHLSQRQGQSRRGAACPAAAPAQLHACAAPRQSGNTLWAGPHPGEAPGLGWHQPTRDLSAHSAHADKWEVDALTHCVRLVCRHVWPDEKLPVDLQQYEGQVRLKFFHVVVRQHSKTLIYKSQISGRPTLRMASATRGDCIRPRISSSLTFTTTWLARSVLQAVINQTQYLGTLRTKALLSLLVPRRMADHALFILLGGPASLKPSQI